MARRRKPQDVVDGFATMKAAQRAVSGGAKAGKKKAAPAASSKKRAKATKPAAKPAAKARIGHTAEPTRHDIVCYECGYAFVITGVLQQTYCPKCRVILDAGEHAIERKWAGIIKTIGTVTVGPKGLVNGGQIVANKIVLSGRIEAGKIKVFGPLEVASGAQFDPAVVDARDLVIMKGAEQVFSKSVTFGNIAVSGVLKGRITSKGVIRVLPGGFLRGQIKGQHLVVEDGGGLSATLKITANTRASKRSSKGG